MHQPFLCVGAASWRVLALSEATELEEGPRGEIQVWARWEGMIRSEKWLFVNYYGSIVISQNFHGYQNLSMSFILVFKYILLYTLSHPIIVNIM
jgi:hypothetical protein